MKQVRIKNQHIALTVLDYGAIIQKIEVLDKTGKPVNVVVGLEKAEAYTEDNMFLGACIGRYAGRISKGGFSLEGKNYTVYSEDGIHLHGGKEGFGKKYWTIEATDNGPEPFVRLSYKSEDMEEGYPGNLKATVTYLLVDHTLHIVHEATTDKTTVVNLTNHSYFNLDGKESIDDYQMRLECSAVVQTKTNLIPTGDIVSILDTPIDFTTEKRIGQLKLDTPFVIDRASQLPAEIYSPLSGIHMHVTTNQPAIVIYTPAHFAAICFETQNYPDAPNNISFPSSVLKPGEHYRNASQFTFSRDTP